MKLAVFGGSGRTGVPLLQQALEKGYVIKVLVRDPSKLTIRHKNLQVIKGDAMNWSDVDKTIEHADVVLSVLGQNKDSPAKMQTTAFEHIVRAMKKHGVTRVISLTGAGVEDPENDKPKLVNHLIKAMLKMMAGKVYRDARGHSDLLRESGLDWTIVRVPMLNDNAFTGKYRVGSVGVNTGTKICRADIADFMLKQIDSREYIHRLPMISN